MTISGLARQKPLKMSVLAAMSSDFNQRKTKNLLEFARRATIIGLFWPLASLGCSGELAATAMERAKNVGRLSLALTVAMVATTMTLVFIAYRRKRTTSILSFLSLLSTPLHPALWLSPFDGDCGQELLIFSIVFGLGQASILYLTMATHLRARVQKQPEQKS
jgi:hypothetical protein